MRCPELPAKPASISQNSTPVFNVWLTSLLYGRGVGWIDAHLLASARLSGCHVHTLDARLSQAARELGV